MKKVLLILGALFIYNSGLYAFAMRGESEKSNYNIVSMTAKIVIECENGDKSFIKKYKDLYYASKKNSFTSFKKAAKYACDLKLKKHISKQRTKKVRKNARLRKNAIVCRTQKSVIYLLKDTEHYQSVLNGLQSQSIYKNCFIGKANYKVAVTNHYHNKNLIHNYYRMQYGENNGDNIRYAPIISIKSIGSNRKNQSKHLTKRKIRRDKVSKNIKSKTKQKHKNKHKNVKKIKVAKNKSYVKPKVKTIKSTPYVMSENSYIKPEKKSEVIRYVEADEEDYSSKQTDGIVTDTEIKSYEVVTKKPDVTIVKDSDTIINHESKIIKKNTSTGLEVYRCSVSSIQTGKIFTGQHVNDDASKNIALKNCQSEEKTSDNCQFEHCFILKLM